MVPQTIPRYCCRNTCRKRLYPAEARINPEIFVMKKDSKGTPHEASLELEE